MDLGWQTTEDHTPEIEANGNNAQKALEKWFPGK
jgi:hypothetical protein